MLKPYNKAELTFEILEEIGADGKNSQAFVVRDHQLNADIVAKRLVKKKLGDVANFFEEAQILYASAHPNVVQIHYACYDDDHIYLAMPYYRKGSIKGLITGRMMTIREVIVAACQMLSGLHHIHSKKLIHFDIKPDNILLSNRGEALLSDFGHAKQTNYKGVAPQDRPYTPMIPPEGFKDQEYDVTFDIYQVGLTLYRMCNGNDAFREQLEQYGPKIANREDFRFDVRNAKFPDRKAFAPHVPSKLRKIIRKCLETDPSKRYHSAIEVANALAEIDGPMLGWRLAATPARRVWTKNENGTEYELSVHPDGKSELYKCVNGGARRRVTDGCRASTTDRDLQTLLGSY